MPKIDIKGTIVSNDDKWIYDWFGYESVCPKDISKALADANGQALEVDINSGGGDIFAGADIYTAIRNYSGDVKINIVGLAASAASVIAMARKSQITPTGMFMVHNVSSGASGDYHDMEHMADVLKVANQSIANAYKEKTGLSDSELLAIMDKETWMSAQEAVDNKFVDSVMFSSGFINSKKMYLQNNSNIIPRDTIEKLRETIKNQKETNQPTVEEIHGEADFLVQKAQSQLNLLKLKGALE